MTENIAHLLPSLTAADNRVARYTPPDDEDLSTRSESSTCVLGQSGYCQVYVRPLFSKTFKSTLGGKP